MRLAAALTPLLCAACTLPRPEPVAPAGMSCAELAAEIRATRAELHDGLPAKIGEMWLDLGSAILFPGNLADGVLPREDPIRLADMEQAAAARGCTVPARR